MFSGINAPGVIQKSEKSYRSTGCFKDFSSRNNLTFLGHFVTCYTSVTAASFPFPGAFGAALRCPVRMRYESMRMDYSTTFDLATFPSLSV